jgi:hypothetical protein
VGHVKNNNFIGEGAKNMDNFYRIYTNLILGGNVIYPYGFRNPSGIVVFKQRLWNMAIFFTYSLRFLSV